MWNFVLLFDIDTFAWVNNLYTVCLTMVKSCQFLTLIPFKESRIEMMHKLSVMVRFHFLLAVVSCVWAEKQNPVASSVDFTVIVVIVADSTLTGWLCNVTGMSQLKFNSIWSNESMTSPSLGFLISLVKNQLNSVVKDFLYLLYSLKLCFSVSVHFPFVSSISPLSSPSASPIFSRNTLPRKQDR